MLQAAPHALSAAGLSSPVANISFLFDPSAFHLPSRIACRRVQELQEIVEQIDAAATFAKIGGFGRLIALVAPARRPEKVRLRLLHPSCRLCFLNYG